MQRGDYEAAFAEPITVPAVQPELLTNLRDADRLILDGDHDVFGDGRVRLISAPGHTPGHQVLFVDLDWTGPLETCTISALVELTDGFRFLMSIQR